MKQNKFKLMFKGKVVLITGSTRGIGKSMAVCFNALGARVIRTGTKPAGTGTKDYLQLDLNNDLSLEKFISEIKKLKHIDVLVNNAGINIIEPVDEIKDEHWDKIIKVNLTGAMKITRAVARIMKKNKQGGKILNVSSVFGIISKAKRDAYSASKAGLIGLMRASALDLAPYNILVNALCPGFTMTDLTKSILSKKEIEQLSREIPLGRFAREEEIACAAAFICSDLNTYMTGQAFVVDGGVSIV